MTNREGVRHFWRWSDRSLLTAAKSSSIWPAFRAPSGSRTPTATAGRDLEPRVLQFYRSATAKRRLSSRPCIRGGTRARVVGMQGVTNNSDIDLSDLVRLRPRANTSDSPTAHFASSRITPAARPRHRRRLPAPEPAVWLRRSSPRHRTVYNLGSGRVSPSSSKRARGNGPRPLTRPTAKHLPRACSTGRRAFAETWPTACSCRRRFASIKAASARRRDCFKLTTPMSFRSISLPHRTRTRVAIDHAGSSRDGRASCPRARRQQVRHGHVEWLPLDDKTAFLAYKPSRTWQSGRAAQERCAPWNADAGDEGAWYWIALLLCGAGGRVAIGRARKCEREVHRARPQKRGTAFRISASDAGLSKFGDSLRRMSMHQSHSHKANHTATLITCRLRRCWHPLEQKDAGGARPPLPSISRTSRR